jgi:hypothetical protein
MKLTKYQFLKIVLVFFLITTVKNTFAEKVEVNRVANIVNQESYSISGTVTDEKGQPIPGATAFLANTKKATATDGSGKFFINLLPSGSYELVVRMLGYEPDVRIIKIEDRSATLNIKLKEAAIELNAVTINAKRDFKAEPKRKMYMGLFIKNFIGQAPYADPCTILNPDVIRFQYNRKTDILTATADEMIEVKNEGLGYQLKYLLKDFKIYLKYNVCFYSGYPYFEEMTGTEEQKNIWADHRKGAYIGTSRHFFRAVMNNTTKEEGFTVHQYIQQTWARTDSMPIGYVPFDSLFVKTKDNGRMLVTKAIIRKNIGERTVTGYDTVRPEIYVNYQRVKAKLRVFADTIVIDKELLLNPTKNFTFTGYWALPRTAMLIPLDYYYDPVAEEKARAAAATVKTE